MVGSGITYYFRQYLTGKTEKELAELGASNDILQQLPELYNHFHTQKELHIIVARRLGVSWHTMMKMSKDWHRNNHQAANNKH